MADIGKLLQYRMFLYTNVGDIFFNKPANVIATVFDGYVNHPFKFIFEWIDKHID